MSEISSQFISVKIHIKVHSQSSSLLHGVVPVPVPLLVDGGVDGVLTEEPPDVDLLLLPVAPDAPDRLRVRLRVLLLVLRQHRVHEDGVVARLQSLHIGCIT